MNWGFAVVQMPDNYLAIYEVYHGEEGVFNSDSNKVEHWVDDPIIVADDYDGLLWVIDQLKKTVEKTEDGQRPLMEMSESYSEMTVVSTATEGKEDPPDESCLL